MNNIELNFTFGAIFLFFAGFSGCCAVGFYFLPGKISSLKHRKGGKKQRNSPFFFFFSLIINLGVLWDSGCCKTTLEEFNGNFFGGLGAF